MAGDIQKHTLNIKLVGGSAHKKTNEVKRWRRLKLILKKCHSQCVRNTILRQGFYERGHGDIPLVSKTTRRFGRLREVVGVFALEIHSSFFVVVVSHRYAH